MWFWFAPFILIAPEPLPDGLLPVRNEMPEIRSGGPLSGSALAGKLRASIGPQSPLVESRMIV
jgi:hypothetical protein